MAPPRRFTFPRPSDEMKRFAALLEAEVMRWPGVRTGKMFGMVSLYRGDAIFALLPATRSLEGATSIMIKREAPAGQKAPAKGEGHKWKPLEVHSDADLGEALLRLEEAYARASPTTAAAKCAAAVRALDAGREGGFGLAVQICWCAARAVSLPAAWRRRSFVGFRGAQPEVAGGNLVAGRPKTPTSSLPMLGGVVEHVLCAQRLCESTFTRAESAGSLYSTGVDSSSSTVTVGIFSGGRPAEVATPSAICAGRRG